MCRYMLDRNSFGHDVGPKVVQADRQVLCARARASAVVSGDFNARLVILKYLAMYEGCRRVKNKTTPFQSVKKVHHADECYEISQSLNVSIR